MWKSNENPYFIHEFKHSILVIGDHQFYKGYSLLLLKEHEKDITDLSFDIQKEYLEEVMLAGKFLKSHFKAYRLNYSCLGNFVEHVHIHIFPRYKKDLEAPETRNPWWNTQGFKESTISSEEAKTIADQLKVPLKKFLKENKPSLSVK